MSLPTIAFAPALPLPARPHPRHPRATHRRPRLAPRRSPRRSPRPSRLPPRATARPPVATEQHATLTRDLAALSARVEANLAVADVPARRAAIADLQAESQAASFWDAPDAARAQLRDLAAAEAVVARATGWSVALDDARASLALLPDAADDAADVAALLGEARALADVL